MQTTKNVVLQRSLHPNVAVGIRDNTKEIPEMVDFYNAAVDVIDQMSLHHTCTYFMKTCSIAPLAHSGVVQHYYLARINSWGLCKVVTMVTITHPPIFSSPPGYIAE